MRARIKSAEEMPEWQKCCPANATALKPFYNREVELVGKPKEVTYTCRFCGYTKTDMAYFAPKGVGDGNGCLWLIPGIIDIEEGATA